MYIKQKNFVQRHTEATHLALTLHLSKKKSIFCTYSDKCKTKCLNSFRSELFEFAVQKIPSLIKEGTTFLQYETCEIFSWPIYSISSHLISNPQKKFGNSSFIDYISLYHGMIIALFSILLFILL